MRSFASIIVLWAGDSKVVKGPAGLCVSFPAKELADSTRWDIAFPLNAETRRMIEQAILAEYKKIVAGNSPSPNVNAKQYTPKPQ